MYIGGNKEELESRKETNRNSQRQNWYPLLSLTTSSHGDADGTHDKLAHFPSQLVMHVAQNSDKVIQQEELQ